MEKLLWSIALPGFGQLLNGKFFKGTLFIFLEFLINVQANFNEVIILTFHGQIKEAIQQTNYQWLCGKHGKMQVEVKNIFLFLPFVFSAYFVTIGCMYSPNVKLFGVLLGPYLATNDLRNPRCNSWHSVKEINTALSS
jgi:hypothetical protein